MATPASPAADRPGAFPWPPVLLVLAAAGSVVLWHLVPLPWPGVGDGAASLVGLGFGAPASQSRSGRP